MKPTNDNYDEANIADIREKWAKEPIKKQAYRFTPRPIAPSEVKITKESRRLCAIALLSMVKTI